MFITYPFSFSLSEGVRVRRFKFHIDTILREKKKDGEGTKVGRGCFIASQKARKEQSI